MERPWVFILVNPWLDDNRNLSNAFNYSFWSIILCVNEISLFAISKSMLKKRVENVGKLAGQEGSADPSIQNGAVI